ncbi:MAG TPA: YciI-like protein [Desulfuromonadales bacterium]|nr:YciI-like protein [Desulfuromonadales bacterium]
MHYLLMYEVSSDYLERRGEFRTAHLSLAWQAAERGELVLGGAAGDPPESSILLFRCNSPDVPAAFAQADPYVLNGLVTKWRVLPWNTVVGREAANPVRVD